MATLSELLEQAQAHHRNGAWDAAEQEYREVLARAPDNVDVRRDLAWLLVQKGDQPGGIVEMRQAIACAPHVAALSNDLGMMLNSVGQSEEAVLSFQAAVARDPSLWQAAFNLGNAQLRLGRAAEAIENYRTALNFVPNDPDVHLNLGVAQRDLGRLPAARASFERALALRPRQAEAWINLASVERTEGQPERAIECLQRALAINPNSAIAHNNLGSTWRAANDFVSAAASFERAVRINPNYGTAYANLGDALESLGRLDEAIACYRKAQELKTSDALKIKARLALPVILESFSQIDQVRLRLARELAALAAGPLHVDDPVTELGALAFTLAYQGKDERDFQSQIAAIVRRLNPSLPFTAPHCRAGRTPGTGRIKIGFLSAHFKNHTIGKLNAGLIEQLDRQKFEVFVLRFAGPLDKLGTFIAESADHCISLPFKVEAAQAMIAPLELDVLIYTDIGIDAITCYLAHARLAPLQCVTWGHPLTTGIFTLYYFISSDDLEPAEGQRSYTETLVRLPWLANYYFRPAASTSTKTRADFDLTETAHVYACLQSPFKLHPDDDALLAGILRGDPSGTLLLLEGPIPNWNQLLRARLGRSIPDVVDQIRFAPLQPPEDFSRLLSLVDVLLDPLHFGGGETSYQSFAVGTPIVTLPGKFLRSRITYALYRTMGISDAIATSREDYVARAVWLGTNRAVRDELRDRILAANHKIFENIAAVREFETFIAQAVADWRLQA